MTEKKNKVSKNSTPPKGWRKVRLGEIAIFDKGKKPKHLVVKKISEDFEEYILLGDEKLYAKKENYLVFVIPTDIIMVADGASSGLIFTNKKGVLGSTFLRIRIKPEFKEQIDPKYLYFYLKYSENIFRSVLTGSAIPHVDQENLRSFDLFFLEDINEQKRIADILSAFDEKIELNNKINQTLEQIAQAIFKEWFVRGRKEELRECKLGELMKLRKEKFKNFNEWKNLRLLDLGRIPRKSLTVISYGKGEEIKTAGIKFKKGDILFGAVRPYFHKVVVAPFDGVTNSSVFVIMPKKDYHFSLLLTILFSVETINYASKCASGTKMPIVKWNDLCNMKIYIPEEKDIKKFNELVKPFYDVIIKNSLENQKLAALRDLLLPKLMSGEIRV